MNAHRTYLIFTLLVFSVIGAQVTPRLAYTESGHRHDEDSHEGHDHSTKSKNGHEGHDHGKDDDSRVQQDDRKKKPHQQKEHAGHDDHEGHGGHEGHDDHGEEGVINLDDEARSMIQLKTEKVSRRSLGGHLKVYGKIAKDTENYSYVTFDGEGTVESIKTKLGDIVNKGTELLTVERDNGAHERIKSEIHGMVMSIFVKPGDRVETLTSLISVIDVDTLRATIDIYERDLRLVQVGQDVKLSTAAYPDKIFKGKVVYISPQVDEHTQAIKVRVDIDNPEHLLRLGMFVSGELIYSSKREVLAIPLTAVQRLEEEDIVFVAEEGSSLRLREVVLGRGVNDYVEVRKGLVEGEVVVTQGSFYLKSEQAKESFGHGHAH